MTQYQPKDFAEELSLLSHKREVTASSLEFLKWVVLTAGALGSFVLIDYQREKRADDVERTRLKISIFENYIGENDENNLLLWERKLRKLEAFVENDQSLLEFARKEREQLDSLKMKREEALALAEEAQKIDQQLVTLQDNSAIPELPENVDLANPETLQTIPIDPAADPLPPQEQESIVQFNSLIRRRLENEQALKGIERDFRNNGLDLRLEQ